MNECVVTFLPGNTSVTAARGKTILEVAASTSMPINNICGGDGVCGKCRIIVKSGTVNAEPNMFLTRKEIQQGIALACQTYIEGDCTIEIPPESRIKGIPNLEGQDALRFGPIAKWEDKYPVEPLVHKIYLELDPPSENNTISDQEKLYSKIRLNRTIPVMQAGLTILQQLPSLLRENNWKITVTSALRGGTEEIVRIDPGDTSEKNYGVAIDLGTTTIVAHLINLNTAETIGSQAKYNSQIKYGEDVISRIMYANTEEKLNELNALAVNDINDLIAGLILESKVRLKDINYIMFAGNTTMTHLLYGIDVSNIRKEPYIPVVLNMPVIRAAEIGIKINARGLLSAVPSVASYVGGDILAGILFCGMHESNDLSLLIDMGTNGEMVLGNNEWLMCCSASAGPSFEGGEITCGMRATKGAIERLVMSDNGDIKECSIIEGDKPIGICGSGLIDTISEMARVGCIDRAGNFVVDKCGHKLQGDKGNPEFIIFPSSETALGKAIYITKEDIKNFIRSKGAIYSATDALLHNCGMQFEDLKHIYVAGGFGNYLDVPKAIRIGLLPDLPVERFTFIGNGSLQGAKISLLSRKALHIIKNKIAKNMTNIELSLDPYFMNEFSGSLFLPHANIEKFKSIMGSLN